MALESYCAACTYLGETADYNGKYYCSKRGDVYACDPKCYNFCEAYRRSNSARENMYNNSKGHISGGGCYLTTTMCSILNLPDNNEYLETLRTFRETILKQDIKHLPILIAYDVIGPMISYNLNNDPNKLEIATSLFNNYITKAVDAIKENKTTEAINIYKAMTTSLAEKYNINTNILYIDPNSINIDKIDLNTLGHGRTKKKSSY